jgi:hypothetical protein
MVLVFEDVKTMMIICNQNGLQILVIEECIEEEEEERF